MAEATIDLQKRASEIRGKLIRMSHKAETAHLASSMSCVDILTAAYWGVLRIDPTKPDDPDRDRFILSKGHAISALYATLAYRGYFPVEELEKYNVPGGRLPEQPSPHCVPGMEWATGSLGHGLSVGIGFAMAARIQNRNYRVYVVLSDGECNEGSVWEAAMFAPAQKLGRLTAIVDYNGLQATGRSNEILNLSPLREKWAAAGWNAVEVNGHDTAALIAAMKSNPADSDKPLAIIARTVKGKGVSFMEDNNDWHYRSPNEADVANAWKELGLA